MTDSWIRVQQIRSPIRRHHSQRETLIGLGLNRIGRVRVLPDTAPTRGMISKVAHLVAANLVAKLTADIEGQLETLRRFNRKVDHVERSRFWKRYENKE